MKFVSISAGDLSLTPLKRADLSPLQIVAQDIAIWQHNPGMKDPKDFEEKWFKKAWEAMEKGIRWPYMIYKKGACIGSSSFYATSMEHKSTTIGYTWLNPMYWGSGLNAHIKQCMLQHAFKSGMHRVAFEIDANNIRSRKAVEKLGAKFEGILRHHMIRSDGSLRDTVMYSILAGEFK